MCTYVSMAQQTSSRKSKRLSSAKRESQMRMTSGSRNSWDKSNVSQRKAKNWGLMFCSCCQTGTRQTMSTCSWSAPYRQEITPCFHPRLLPNAALSSQLILQQQENLCILWRLSHSTWTERFSVQPHSTLTAKSENAPLSTTWSKGSFSP